MHPRTIFIIAALALATPWCAAQAVYRCGNHYGTEPCAGGKPVDTAHNGPTGAESARATKVAESDARRADVMEKARLAQEKNAPRAIVIGPTEPPKPVVGEKKARPTKPETFTATVPGTGKQKKKN